MHTWTHRHTLTWHSHTSSGKSGTQKYEQVRRKAVPLAKERVTLAAHALHTMPHHAMAIPIWSYFISARCWPPAVAQSFGGPISHTQHPQAPGLGPQTRLHRCLRSLQRCASGMDDRWMTYGCSWQQQSITKLLHAATGMPPLTYINLHQNSEAKRKRAAEPIYHSIVQLGSTHPSGPLLKACVASGCHPHRRVRPRHRLCPAIIFNSSPGSIWAVNQRADGSICSMQKWQPKMATTVQKSRWMHRSVK